MRMETYDVVLCRNARIARGPTQPGRLSRASDLPPMKIKLAHLGLLSKSMSKSVVCLAIECAQY